jgi:hypothetical protein
MHHRWFYPRSLDVVGALAAAILLLLATGAIAAPERFDCNLNEIETKAGLKSDFEVENRSISVVFDAAEKMLTVYQDDRARVLNNVTISLTSMNGYVSEMSIGIDSASRSIVFQTYETDTVRVEFGTCRPSAEPPP